MCLLLWCVVSCHLYKDFVVRQAGGQDTQSSPPHKLYHHITDINHILIIIILHTLHHLQHRRHRIESRDPHQYNPHNHIVIVHLSHLTLLLCCLLRRAAAAPRTLCAALALPISFEFSSLPFHRLSVCLSVHMLSVFISAPSKMSVSCQFIIKFSSYLS